MTMFNAGPLTQEMVYTLTRGLIEALTTEAMAHGVKPGLIVEAASAGVNIAFDKYCLEQEKAEAGH